VKPTVGLSVAAYAGSRRWWTTAGAGGALLVLAALVLEPRWPTAWLDALRERPAGSVGVAGGISALYSAPVTVAGGALALAAFLRWRRPEARLLGVLALVPHIMTGYEFVPLLALVPSTLAEALLLAALSWVARVGFALGSPYPDLQASYVAAGRWGVYCVLLPATLLVLRRPNVGAPRVG
jgi:hypothetical protein